MNATSEDTILALPLADQTAAEKFRNRKTRKTYKFAAMFSMLMILMFGGVAALGGTISSMQIASAANPFVPDKLECIGASVDAPKAESIQSTDGMFPKIDPKTNEMVSSLKSDQNSIIADMVPSGPKNLNPDVKYTLYDTFGMAGTKWVTWVPDAQKDKFNKCGINGIMESAYNGIANFIFLATKGVTSLAIVIYQWALSGQVARLLGVQIACIISGDADQKLVFGSVVFQCREGLFNSVFMPFFQPVIMFGALWMGYRGLYKREFSSAWQGAMWMTGIGVLTMLVSTYPLTMLAAAETTVNNISTAATTAFSDALPDRGTEDICYTNAPKGNKEVKDAQADTPGKNFGVTDKVSKSISNYVKGSGSSLNNSTRTQQRMAACSIYKALVFTPWAQGQFGVPLSYELPAKGEYAENGEVDKPKSDKVKLAEEEYANRWTNMGLRTATIDALALWNGEAQSQKDPKKVEDNDRDRFFAVAERSLPIQERMAWGNSFMGDNAVQRIGIAFLSLVGAICVGIVIISIAFSTIIYTLVMLMLFAFSPFFLLLSLYPGDFGRKLARRYGSNLLSTVIRRILLGMILGFLIYLYSLVFSLSDGDVLNWMIQLVLLVAITIAVMKLKDPLLETLGVVNLNSAGGQNNRNANQILNRNLTGGGAGGVGGGPRSSGNLGGRNGSLNRLMNNRWMGGGETPATFGGTVVRPAKAGVKGAYTAGKVAGAAATGGMSAIAGLAAEKAASKAKDKLAEKAQTTAFGDEELYGAKRNAKKFGSGVAGDNKTVNNKTVPLALARKIGDAQDKASNRFGEYGSTLPGVKERTGALLGGKSNLDGTGSIEGSQLGLGDTAEGRRNFINRFGRSSLNNPSDDSSSLSKYADATANRLANSRTFLVGGRGIQQGTASNIQGNRTAAGMMYGGVGSKRQAYTVHRGNGGDASARAAMINQSMQNRRAEMRQNLSGKGENASTAVTTAARASLQKNASSTPQKSQAQATKLNKANLTNEKLADTRGKAEMSNLAKGKDDASKLTNNKKSSSPRPSEKTKTKMNKEPDANSRAERAKAVLRGERPGSTDGNNGTTSSETVGKPASVKNSTIAKDDNVVIINNRVVSGKISGNDVRIGADAGKPNQTKIPKPPSVNRGSGLGGSGLGGSGSPRSKK